MPVVPAAHYVYLLGSWDFLCFVHECMVFAFQPWGTLQDSSENADDFPVRFPVLPLDKIKQFDILTRFQFFLPSFHDTLNLLLNSRLININLILQPIELVIPPSRYIFLLHHTFSSILPDFFITGFVFVAVQGSTHAPFEIFEVVF